MNLTIENGEIKKEDLALFHKEISNDEYVIMMLKALAKVSKNYITYGSSYHLERTYVCELYHQWSKLLEEKGSNHNHLCLNGEPCKDMPKETKDTWKFPDLILHHSQFDNVDNRIACEFKRKIWNESGFNKDMETLNFLLTGAADNTKLTQNFKWGVFVQIGGTINNLKNYVKHHSFNHRILCVVVDDEVSKLIIHTIGELMTNKKCNKCNAVISDSAKFCSECGNQIMFNF